MNATPRNTTRSEVRDPFDRSALPTASAPRRAFVDIAAKALGSGLRRRLHELSQHKLAAKCCILSLLQAASMLLAAGAQAQSSACNQFKDTLAARIDPSIRGFTLEAVPANAPVPPGAKVFGTCDGGAFKILFRRGGSTRPSPGGASAATPAPTPQAAVVPDKQTPRSPVVRIERAASPAPASAPNATPQPVSRSTEAASSVATPGLVPEKPVVSYANEVEAVRATDRAVAPPAQAGRTIEAKVPPAQQASDFMAEKWRWLWALVLLPIAGWLWAWHAHRSAYDEAGLPRGPKL